MADNNLFETLGEVKLAQIDCLLQVRGMGLHPGTELLPTEKAYNEYVKQVEFILGEKITLCV